MSGVLAAPRGSLIAALAIGLAAPTSRPIAAQDLFDQKGAAEIRNRFLADADSAHVKIMALAELIPADKYGWSATPETRTVANALMHVASEWYYYVPLVMGGKAPAGMGAPREEIPKLEKVATKAEVLEHLKKAWAHAKAEAEAADLKPLLGTRQFFGRPTTLPELLFAMAGDLHEHLGQLVTYTRSLGLVPPWSKPRK